MIRKFGLGLTILTLLILSPQVRADALPVQATAKLTSIQYFPNYVQIDMTLSGSGTPIGSFTGSATYFWDYDGNGMGMGSIDAAGGSIMFFFNGGVDPNGVILGNYSIMGGTGLYSNA